MLSLVFLFSDFNNTMLYESHLIFASTEMTKPYFWAAKLHINYKPMYIFPLTVISTTLLCTHTHLQLYQLQAYEHTPTYN